MNVKNKNWFYCGVFFCVCGNVNINRDVNINRGIWRIEQLRLRVQYLHKCLFVQIFYTFTDEHFELFLKIQKEFTPLFLKSASWKPSEHLAEVCVC